jgi:hypothetical protein
MYRMLDSSLATQSIIVTFTTVCHCRWERLLSKQQVNRKSYEPCPHRNPAQSLNAAVLIDSGCKPLVIEWPKSGNWTCPTLPSGRALNGNCAIWPTQRMIRIGWSNQASLIGAEMFGTHTRYDVIGASDLMESPMDIKPIKTDADYHTALKEIETLMMAEASSPEGACLDVLVTLVEAYERQHFPCTRTTQAIKP